MKYSIVLKFQDQTHRCFLLGKDKYTVKGQIIVASLVTSKLISITTVLQSIHWME